MTRSSSENRREKVGKDDSNARGKRKVDESHKDSSSKRHKSSRPVTNPSAKKAWRFNIPETSWFPGKITITPLKGVMTNFRDNLNEAQRVILRNTCFAHFLECEEIVVQSQLIHYFLLRQVQQPNDSELWFNIDGRFVRFSLPEFCLVTGLRYVGDVDTKKLEKTRSRLKKAYFSTKKIVTHEDVKQAFLSAHDIPDEDVCRLGALYFITSYLYPRDYKKVVEHSLFVLVEDFNLLNLYPWGKSLFDTLVSSLREGLSKRTTHYRLRGLLVAFQVWIYETIPSLDGSIVRRISRMYPRIRNWTADDRPSAAMLDGPDCFSNPDMEICDMDPPEIELAMPYMNGVEYIKPLQPDQSRGEKRKGDRMDRSRGDKRKGDRMDRSVRRAGTSRKPSASVVKPSTPLLMITDGRLGHTDVHVDDDDFVDPPPRWQGTSFDGDSPGREGQSASTKEPQTPDSDDHPSNDMLEELRTQFSGQISELQSKNHSLHSQLNAMQSQMSSLRSDQQKKLNIVMRMQGEIRTDLMDIKTNMQFLSESVTALITSSMEEILNKFSEKTGPHDVRDSEPTHEVRNVDKGVDSKGKGKVDTVGEFELPYSLQPPSFDLGVGSTQPSQLEAMTPKEVQVHVDTVISNVLKETDYAEPEESPKAAPSSGLPVKRAPRPAKALQSPYLGDEGREIKSSRNLVVFEHYNQHANDGDIADFQNWFQRGYKPRNKKKFNDRDDLIRPPFVVGEFLVGNKTWWYELVSRETSLTSSHMDVCFFYVRQLARYGKNIKFIATTTDSLFQAKLKNMYPKFKKNPNVVTEERLLDDLTGSRIPLSTPWDEVQLVFIPILPINKAHWMLAVLDIKNHTLRVLNSARKTYNDVKVRIGIEPFVNMIPHLMKRVGVWKEDSLELKVDLDFSLPQQKNGHDCGIYVIKFAEYMLHDDIGSMSMRFDAGRARLDMASLLFKCRELKKTTKKLQQTGGDSIVIE